jgi:hypothetical protein
MCALYLSLRPGLSPGARPRGLGLALVVCFVPEFFRGYGAVVYLSLRPGLGPGARPRGLGLALVVCFVRECFIREYGALYLSLRPGLGPGARPRGLGLALVVCFVREFRSGKWRSLSLVETWARPRRPTRGLGLALESQYRFRKKVISLVVWYQRRRQLYRLMMCVIVCLSAKVYCAFLTH